MGLITTTLSTPSQSLVEVEEGTRIMAPNILITSLDKLVNWGRSSSLWPLTFGLA
jgi:NADH:ubiquinone oxidoreductase subunit B-like Fe-S oxidoreductase